MSFFGNRRQTDLPPAPTLPRAAERPAESPRQSAPSLPQPVGFETVLGATCTLEGSLKSNANVRLDGTFTGTLEITGNVLVGETAKITADINARNISIAGAVRGNVSGKKVQLLRTGRIWGDIRAQALTTEEGAFIDGKITIITQEVAAVEPSSLNTAGSPSQISSTPAENAGGQNAPSPASTRVTTSGIATGFAPTVAPPITPATMSPGEMVGDAPAPVQDSLDVTPAPAGTTDLIEADARHGATDTTPDDSRPASSEVGNPSADTLSEGGE